VEYATDLNDRIVGDSVKNKMPGANGAGMLAAVSEMITSNAITQFWPDITPKSEGIGDKIA